MFKILALAIGALFTFSDFLNGQEHEPPLQLRTIYSSTENYTLLKEIGFGVFGTVYAAENSSGHRYAIKEFKETEDLIPDNPMKNAEREYQIGQLLNHSNIVKTIEFFEENSASDNRVKYLVLELVEGKDLMEIAIGKRSLNPHSALNMCLQLVDALRYAFSKKFIYRDLHLYNIMITTTSDITFIDLGSFSTFDELLAELEEAENKKNQPFTISHPTLSRQNKQEKIVLPISQSLQKNPEISKMKNSLSLNRMENLEVEPKELMSTLSWYFDAISEICVKLMIKSHLNREEKIRLCVAIKTLTWNYSENSADDVFVSIEYYFDELMNILKSGNILVIVESEKFSASVKAPAIE